MVNRKLPKIQSIEQGKQSSKGGTSFVVIHQKQKLGMDLRWYIEEMDSGEVEKDFLQGASFVWELFCLPLFLSL